MRQGLADDHLHIDIGYHAGSTPRASSMATPRHDAEGRQRPARAGDSATPGQRAATGCNSPPWAWRRSSRCSWTTSRSGRKTCSAIRARSSAASSCIAQGTSYHLPTGGAVYFDTGVIEVATPVIEIERGCARACGTVAVGEHSLRSRRAGRLGAAQSTRTRGWSASARTTTSRSSCRARARARRAHGRRSWRCCSRTSCRCR